MEHPKIWTWLIFIVVLGYAVMNIVSYVYYKKGKSTTCTQLPVMAVTYASAMAYYITTFSVYTHLTEYSVIKIHTLLYFITILSLLTASTVLNILEFLTYKKENPTNAFTSPPAITMWVSCSMWVIMLTLTILFATIWKSTDS